MGPVGEEGVDPESEGFNKPFANMAGGGGGGREEWLDWQSMKKQIKEEASVHDEL
jgi:hypothetical protein